MERLLALIVLVATLGTSPAASNDHTVQNRQGDVRYQSGSGDERPLEQGRTASLSDGDVVRTGANSLAEVMFPDSSLVAVGSGSVVKFDSYSGGRIDAAHVVIFLGKIRFSIEHPNGAKADYRFTTPVGEVEVHGTRGDIDVDPFQGVSIIVLSDASTLVHVRLVDGEERDLARGQTLLVRWESGKLVTRFGATSY